MPPKTDNSEISGGEAFLRALAERGIDYLFANAGTDFPPIIEAYARHAGDDALPTPVTVPHENLAVAMAHGHTMISGRPQAVMLHVNVGTANAICGLLNASRETIPLLLFAGRTPIHEDDVPGARSVFIHWGQEMFDQAGMLREAVKWDYELRSPRQVGDAVDRALTIATSPPRGPVYMSLPREVIAAPVDPGGFLPAGRRRAPAAPAPHPDSLARLAGMIAEAERPLVITSGFGRDPGAVAALAGLAERYALPVIGYRPHYNFLPTDHPMFMGYEPGPMLADADLILVLDCDVPWIPKFNPVDPKARVVQLGIDPLYERYPMRGFPADLAINADSRLIIEQLDARLAEAPPPAEGIENRRARLAEWRQGYVETRAKLLEAARKEETLSVPAWIAHCVNQVKRDDDVLITETAMPLPMFDFPQPGSHFNVSSAGGLGWGLGAALGAKLAAPERRAIAIVGDGSYMFGNPTPAHLVAAAEDLPTLTIIVNNRMWGAVRRATLGLYPDGAASKANRSAFTHLEPAPDYEKVVEASGGYGEKVEKPADLPGALERALKAVEEDGRQAVLNVMTLYSDAQAASDAKK